MNMISFICPVCGAELFMSGKTYRCANGHSFDVARQGYVNLLTGSAKGRHGDDKLMVRARARLLDSGVYNALAAAVAESAVKFAPEDCVLLDAGCGEGRYTADVLTALENKEKYAQAIGVDISKDALIYAARRCQSLRLAVASTAAIPLADESADMVLNIFSPFMRGEFQRVLKKGGTLIRVIPLARHLWELKALVYDKPYENPPTDIAAEGFTVREERELRYRMSLNSGEEIMDLFRMTPYYYKTGRADQQKAEQAQALDVSAEFGIIIYTKD